MTPAEIAAVTHTQTLIVSIPNNGGFVISSRPERVLLYLQTSSMAITNFFLTPNKPTVTNTGIQIPSTGLLMSHHDWAGTLQLPWFIYQNSGGAVDFFVMESWIG